MDQEKLSKQKEWRKIIEMLQLHDNLWKIEKNHRHNNQCIVKSVHIPHEDVRPHGLIWNILTLTLIFV